jgi:tetratricopeptide (TPR) repeat protein
MLSWLAAAVHYTRGCSHLRKRNYDRAIVVLTNAICRQPNQIYAYINRGVAYQATGEHGRAIEDFSRVIELSPRLPLAFYNRGISWKFLGEFDHAVADHTQAIALLARYASAYSERGIVYFCNDEADLSIADLSTAMKLDPNQSSYSSYRGFARFGRGDYEAAIDDLRRSLDLEDDAGAMLLLYLAQARIGLASTSELDANARRLRSKEWPYPMIEVYLGTRAPEAVLAAATTPQRLGDAQFYVGQWYLARGNRTEAVAALSEAVELCPKHWMERACAVAELKRLA